MARSVDPSCSTSASGRASTRGSSRGRPRPAAGARRRADPGAPAGARDGGPSRRRRRPPGRAPRRDRERAWLAAGAGIVAGLDEAGRGPLAGPVVAAAVILPERVGFRGARDSKLLEPTVREVLSGRIRERASAVSVAAVSPALIDRINILQASRLAMRLALERLTRRPDVALVDGTPLPSFPCPHEAIVGGDRRELAIACASIVAKVARDRMMVDYDAMYPGYGFASHKGYTTRAHVAALRRLGPCRLHRWSFAPVREALRR